MDAAQDAAGCLTNPDSTPVGTDLKESYEAIHGAKRRHIAVPKVHSDTREPRPTCGEWHVEHIQRDFPMRSNAIQCPTRGLRRTRLVRASCHLQTSSALYTSAPTHPMPPASGSTRCLLLIRCRTRERLTTLYLGMRLTRPAACLHNSNWANPRVAMHIYDGISGSRDKVDTPQETRGKDRGWAWNVRVCIRI